MIRFLFFLLELALRIPCVERALHRAIANAVRRSQM